VNLALAGARLPVGRFAPFPQSDNAYAGCRMPDAGCRMPDAGCRMPDAGCRIADAG